MAAIWCKYGRRLHVITIGTCVYRMRNAVVDYIHKALLIMFAVFWQTIHLKGNQ